MSTKDGLGCVRRAKIARTNGHLSQNSFPYCGIAAETRVVSSEARNHSERIRLLLLWFEDLEYSTCQKFPTARSYDQRLAIPIMVRKVLQNSKLLFVFVTGRAMIGWTGITFEASSGDTSSRRKTVEETTMQRSGLLEREMPGCITISLINYSPE